MMPTLGTTLVVSRNVYEGGRPSASLLSPDFANEQALGRTSLGVPVSPQGSVTLAGNASRTMTLSARPKEALEQTLFNVLVGLKVSVSQYAMHLSQEVRHRIFDQLDAIINADDWHEEDDLPRQDAFQEFLKWQIYAGCFDWTSLGVSDEGHILVAWSTTNTFLTANFDGSGEVRWTVRYQSEGSPGHAAGKSSLKFFEKQAQFYLKQE
jgi:hypothetical protein